MRNIFFAMMCYTVLIWTLILLTLGNNILLQSFNWPKPVHYIRRLFKYVRYLWHSRIRLTLSMYIKCGNGWSMWFLASQVHSICYDIGDILNIPRKNALSRGVLTRMRKFDLCSTARPFQRQLIFFVLIF